MEGRINSEIIKLDKKPLKPFMRFREQVFSILIRAHPEFKEEQFDKISSKLWRDMSKADRDVFVRDYEQEIERHQEEMPHLNLKNSMSEQLKRQHYVSRAPNAFCNKDFMMQPKFVPNVFIEEVCSEMEDDALCFKRIAAFRYKLNILLMDSIFDFRKAFDYEFSFAATNIDSIKRSISHLSLVKETMSSEINAMVLEHDSKLRSIEHSRMSYDLKMTDEVCRTIVI